MPICRKMKFVENQILYNIFVLLVFFVVVFRDSGSLGENVCSTSANADSSSRNECSIVSDAKHDQNLASLESGEAAPTRSGLSQHNLLMDGSTNDIGQRPLENSINVWFTIHPNGDGLGEGVRVESKDFPHIDLVIKAHCCQLMNTTAERCAPNSGARLVTDTGVRMLSFNDVEDGQRVYCIPQGLHFVWPLKRTGSIVYPKNVVGPIPDKPIRLRQLSERPRVFAVENFVSPIEIEEILEQNQHLMEPSEVGFGGWQDDTRTSSTSWDDRTEASHSIRTRTFQILAMDENPDMADTLQVLRYTSDGYKGKGEWYKPHVDWFGEDSYDGHNPQVNNGSNRFATMFLYLSDVEEGGATVFPLSTTHEGYNGEKLVHDGTVDTPGYINTADARYCCNETSTALRSKPVRGNAVLFYSQGPDGALDPYSLHGGCPPLKGVKWSANVWIWNRKSPDKSQAKDIPPGDSSLTISFLNNRHATVEIYWDEHSAHESYDGLPADATQLTAIFKASPDRFVHQMQLPGKRESEITSYEGHAFVAFDPSINQAIWSAQVESTGQLLEIN